MLYLHNLIRHTEPEQWVEVSMAEGDKRVYEGLSSGMKFMPDWFYYMNCTVREISVVDGTLVIKLNYWSVES